MAIHDGSRGSPAVLLEAGPTPGLMVVFGAGASFDSIDLATAVRPELEDYRPPLARDLFKSRPVFQGSRDLYDVSASLLDDLSSESATLSIEEVLEDYTTRAETNGALRRRLWALRYYIRSILTSCGDNWLLRAKGRTHYHRLLGDLDAWRGGQPDPKPDLFFVTFNYDQLLDDALPVAIGGPLLAGMDDYISGNSWKLFKPHGSVTWLRVAEGVSTSGIRSDSELVLRVLDASKTADLNLGRWVVRTGGENFLDGTDILVPPLVVPTQGKPFVFPKPHEQALEACLERTRWLLLIGWKMTEQRFLDLLAKHLHQPRTQVVSSTRDRAEGFLLPLRQSLPVGELLASPAVGFGDYAKTQGWRELVEA